jgi:pyrroloquinoline quinone biosynthesis protein E
MANIQSQRTMNWLACEKIINESATMGVTQIAFSGGEPLLWGKLKDAISLANNCGMQTYLYTTGNAPDAEIKLTELKVAGLNKAIFSIFGTNQEEHEAITDVKGSFAASINIINKCVDIGLEVEFHFVPLSTNYDKLEHVANLAEKLRVSCISILRLVPQGRATNTQLLSVEQNIHLRQIITVLRKQGHKIRTGSPYNFLMLREEPECCAGIDRLTIGPDLRIFPCDAFKHISPKELGISQEFSCLKDSSLQECWDKSPYLKKIREYLTTPFAEACQSCQSLEKCLSGCMAQKFHANNELLKTPDPMCLKNHK